MIGFSHIPILAKEISDLLITDKDGIYLDGTLGLGGHSGILLKKLSEKGRIIGLDKDIKAINMAKENVADKRLRVFNLSYTQAQEALEQLHIKGVPRRRRRFPGQQMALESAIRRYETLREVNK